jgi:hypothetical protein
VYQFAQFQDGQALQCLDDALNRFGCHIDYPPILLDIRYLVSGILAWGGQTHTGLFRLRRGLLLLPGGGIVIDTPGMRELSLYSGDVSRTFEDIEELAAQCKFSNCTHSGEAGCAVRRAIDAGVLSERRFANYQKLGREVGYDGMNSRQREQEKLNRMFGGKKALKEFQRNLKKK